MNKNHMNKTPFEAGKTAKELGIDTSREFVVVNADETHQRGEHCIFKNGDRLTFAGGIEDLSPYFTRETDRICTACAWSRLAYADDEAKPEPYQPHVGDRVSLEGEIVSVYATDRPRCDVKLLLPNITMITVPVEDLARAKLLFRAPRTLTKAEAEVLLTEKLGESVRIE